MPWWSMGNIKSTHGTNTHGGGNVPNRQVSMAGPAVIYGDASMYVTAMQLSVDRTKLIVGTSLGSLRVYPWPPEPDQLLPPNAGVVTTAATGKCVYMCDSC